MVSDAEQFATNARRLKESQNLFGGFFGSSS